MLEAERLEDEVANRAIDRRSSHCFDDATRDAETGIVVAPRRTWRRHLHQVRDRAGFDEVFERLRSAIGPRHLPFPSAEVGDKMPDGHVATHCVVAHAEV